MIAPPRLARQPIQSETLRVHGTFGPRDNYWTSRPPATTKQRREARMLSVGGINWIICCHQFVANCHGNSRSASLIRSIVEDHPPSVARNKRIVGYHGESSRSAIHLQSAALGSSVHTGTPSAPLRCAGILSIEMTRSSETIAEARRQIVCVSMEFSRE